MTTNSSKPDPFNPSLAQLLKQLTIDAREGRITQEEKLVIKEELLGRRREFDNADTTSDGSSGSEGDDDELNNFTPEVIEISTHEKKQSDATLVHLLRQLNEHAKRGLIGQGTKLAIKELLLSGRASDIDKAQKMISLALSGSAPKDDPGADLKFDYRKAKQKQLEEMALISRALKHNFQLLSTGPGVADRYSEPDVKTDLTFRVTLNIIFDGIAVDIIFSMPPKYPQGARPSFYIDASFGLSRGDLIALSTLMNNEINKAGDSRDLLVHSLVTMAQSFVLEYVQFSSDLTQPSLSPPSSSSTTTSSFSSSYSARSTTKSTVDSSPAGPWTGLSRVQIPEPEDIMKIFPAVRGYHMERISSEYLEWRFARKRSTLPEEVSRPALAFGEVISTHSVWGNDRRNSNASNSSVDSKGSKGSLGSSKSQRTTRPHVSEPDPISVKTSKSNPSQDPSKRTRRKSDGGSSGGTASSSRRPLEVETERSSKPAIIHSWSMSLGHTYAPETALYGRGIYLSPNPSLCISHTRGGSVCVCLILRGRVYKCPTIQLGGWLTNKFHSHHSPDGQDIILFDSDQILPCYLIHLKPHHTGRPSPLPSPDLSPRSSRSRSGSGSSGGSTPRSRGGGSRSGSRSSTPGSRNNRPGTPNSRNSQPGSRPETPSSQTRSASTERERAATTTSNTSSNSNFSTSTGSPSTSRRSQDLTTHHTPRSKHYVVSQSSTSPKGSQQPKSSLLTPTSSATTRIRTSSSVSGKGGSSKKRSSSSATKKLRDVLRPKRKSHSPQRTSPMKSSQSSGNIVLKNNFRSESPQPHPSHHHHHHTSSHHHHHHSSSLQPPISSIPTVKLLPSGNALSPPSLIQLVDHRSSQQTLAPPSSKYSSQLARSLP